jgi:hypothetical protein
LLSNTIGRESQKRLHGRVRRREPSVLPYPLNPRFPKRAMAWQEVTTRAIGYQAYMETPETEPQAPPDEKPPPEVPDQPGTSPGEPGEPAEPS